ncbi:MAG TPA: ABC transporter permease subunit, partial [Lautropia sp.]|nr:ABC transporter permease subunit [Lautropia sp.]
GLSLVLVLIAVSVLIVEARVRGQATLHRVSSGVRRPAPMVRLGRWRWPGLLLSFGVVLASLGLPLVVLGYWCVRQVLTHVTSPHLLQASQTSVLLGAGAAIIAGVAAVPISVISVRHPSAQTRFLERSTYLTYALPGIVIAIAFVAITVHTPWYQTLGVLMVACACRYAAQVVGATRVSLLQISPRVEEAARGLGSTLPGVLWRVTLPLVRPGWFAGILLVFLTTIKELPITLLLIPAGDRSLPTLIWTAAGDARYGEAAVPALLLVAITAVPTYVLAHRRQALAT